MTTPLEASIEVWKHNLATERAEDLRFGRDVCPLCEAHANCFGCPVARHTGFFGCQRTPYRLVVSAYYDQDCKGPLSDRLKARIQDELSFLESLRSDPEANEHKYNQRLNDAS